MEERKKARLLSEDLLYKNNDKRKQLKWDNDKGGFVKQKKSDQAKKRDKGQIAGNRRGVKKVQDYFK